MKKCLMCDKDLTYQQKYCSLFCRGKGHCGENNVNYQNKAQEPYKEKLLIASRKRGLAWSEEERKAHSERMKGPSNKMRGNKHTKEYKENMSKLKKSQYENGEIQINRVKSSKAELALLQYLKEQNIAVIHQYQIDGIAFIYDFYFPELHLIVEYQGDYWHANPNKYDKGSVLKIQGKKELVPVEQIWKRDRFKKTLAEQKGYKVVYIWETDYKKHQYNVFKELGILTID